MNIQPANIIPVTAARGRLGDLTELVADGQYIVLTKGGKPKAAIVDITYLEKLQNDLKKFYQKTYIDKTLLPFTREFSKAEAEEWFKEDKLT